MKRDMNIIRNILLKAEADEYPYGAVVRLDGVPDEVCAQHVALMIDAGLVEGNIIRSDMCYCVWGQIHRLTNAGHDFAQGIRNDTTWNRILAYVIKPGAAYTLSALLEYVKAQLAQNVQGLLDRM